MDNLFEADRPLDVVPIGRIAIDFNPVECFRPLDESDTFKKYIGGSPANITLGLARLGKKVGFIGAVSDDQFGTFAINYLAKENVDTSGIVRCKNGAKMGLAFTEILSASDSSLLMYRRDVADLQLCTDDIREEMIQNAKAILISGTALAASPSREAVLKCMEYAGKHRTTIIFDLDYRAYTWTSTDEISLYYSLVAQRSDIILGSREEFNLAQRLLIGESSDEETARLWFGFGCKIVVIKHGKEGSAAYTSDGNRYAVKPFPIERLKSFGGGDGYASAFLYGLLEGYDMYDALEFGSASASLLVAAPCCADAMPTAERIRSFIVECKNQYGEMVARE